LTDAILQDLTSNHEDIFGSAIIVPFPMKWPFSIKRLSMLLAIADYGKSRFFIKNIFMTERLTGIENDREY
jgi:hypothetical protein